MLTLVSEATARRVVDIDDAIAETEALLVALDRGQSLLFPAVRGHGSDKTTRFGVKAGYDGANQVPGLKVGSYWPGNRARGLGNHGSTTLLLDDATGLPTAIVAATWLTALRTAAMDAVAVKHLARADAATLVLIGSGHQAYYDALAIARVRSLRALIVCARRSEAAADLAARLCEAGLPARVGELPQALAVADIVSTVTAATAPVLQAADLRPGCHVSAMGADGPGKQELPTQLPPGASLWADSPQQSLTMGEFQHGHAAGAIRADDVRALGGVIAGRIRGRTSPDEITVFDSSGIALQDLAVAALVVRRAREAGLTIDVDLD